MTDTTEKRRIKPLLWINYLFVIILLLTNVSPVLSPYLFWPIALISLAFPVIVLINFLFFIYWLITFKRYLFYSLLAMILSYSLILDHIQFRTSYAQTKEVENQISLLSFNVHNLSNNNVNRGDKVIRNNILQFVDEQNADIICFQEFQSYPTRGVHSVNDFQKKLGHSYFHKFPYLQNNTHEFVDLMVVYSRFPIVNSEDFYMDGKTYGCYVDIDIDGKPVRLFNLHLESNHFDRNDYEIFSEKEVNLNEKKRNQILLLLQKIKKYSTKRSLQARKIRSEIEASPYPVIIAGDLNDVPASFSFHHIKGKLLDAFREKGRGYSNTYNGKLPPMRIDYILTDPNITILDYQVLYPDLSDHFPIIINFIP